MCGPQVDGLHIAALPVSPKETLSFIRPYLPCLFSSLTANTTSRPMSNAPGKTLHSPAGRSPRSLSRYGRIVL